jgi:tRNA A-37 threonylcarbamoyl transferase component Bud32
MMSASSNRLSPIALMQPRPKLTVQLSPDDATLDGQSLATAPRRPSACPRIVEGSTAELATQTTRLLLVRLRAATIALAIGSGAFFIKRLLHDPMRATSDPQLALGGEFLCWFHGIHFFTLVAVATVLWYPRICFTIRQLRTIEVGVFGLTVAFFADVQHVATTFTALKYGYADDPIGIWCLLILSYGMFIPNTVRRAAVMIGALSIAPVLVMAYDSYQLGPAHITVDHFSRLVMFMLIEYGTTVYGTHMIGTLRREAYEARQLGQYRLRHRIGGGGMGDVYLAEHQLLKRPCAIKLIHPDKANDPLALARFEREVRATATLSHWNTVEIFDYGRTDEGTFYYVMEYLPGLSLAELVERYGPLPPERVIHFIQQTCNALGEAHSIGLIHRDVKPGNIFAAQRGGIYDVAKLLDFGLVKPVDAASLDLTQEGLITGSPLYMSPEQAMGETEPDARSDIYSLGAVAYYLLTGKPPFAGDKAMRVIMAHATDPVIAPSFHRADIPADLEQVVLRCLAKNPADRYQDTNQLAEALAECHSAGRWGREQAAQWWSALGEGAAIESDCQAAPA